jgi:hypothetical protein
MELDLSAKQMDVGRLAVVVSNLTDRRIANRAVIPSLRTSKKDNSIPMAFGFGVPTDVPIGIQLGTPYDPSTSLPYAASWPADGAVAAAKQAKIADDAPYDFLSDAAAAAAAKQAKFAAAAKQAKFAADAPSSIADAVSRLPKFDALDVADAADVSAAADAAAKQAKLAGEWVLGDPFPSTWPAPQSKAKMEASASLGGGRKSRRRRRMKRRARKTIKGGMGCGMR